MDDLLWIGPALIAGIAASRFGLPPMEGYLLRGFVLNFTGVHNHDRLNWIGNLGVTLLPFTIGLKLDLRSLIRPVIWAGATLHTVIVIAVLGTLLYWMSLAGIRGFAATFSRYRSKLSASVSFLSHLRRSILGRTGRLPVAQATWVNLIYEECMTFRWCRSSYRR